MTIRDLQRIMDLDQPTQTQEDPNLAKLKRRLYTRPFYVWASAVQELREKSTKVLC